MKRWIEPPRFLPLDAVLPKWLAIRLRAIAHPPSDGTTRSTEP